LAYYEKIVLKLSDLVSLLVHDVSWSEGRKAFTANSHPTHPQYKELANGFSLNSFGLDNRDVEQEKEFTGNVYNKVPNFISACVIRSHKLLQEYNTLIMSPL